jgi:hypothetical protein
MEGLAIILNFKQEDRMASDVFRLELWKTLLWDPKDLDDKMIELLLREESQKWITRRINFLYHSFPQYLEQIQSYRAKKREMDKLSTEELLAIRAKIADRRASILKTVPDEDLGDSFFESPLMDSQEHIVYEILKERG